jgi:alanine dehydrogenase
MLVISANEVRTLLDLDALDDALVAAMSDLSEGRASTPDRIGVVLPHSIGRLAAMPCYVPALNTLVAKLITSFPANAGTSKPTHQAVILAFDPLTGTPQVLMDGTEITAVRTAACSAISVRLLARSDAHVLAVLGTGVQARAHVRAVLRVRPISEIRLAGRDEEKTTALAAEFERELAVPVRATDSYQTALRGADIVCATTHALTPSVRREWLAPGAHVCSVGHNPAGRELDDDTVVDALVCVDARQAALAPLPAGTNDLIEPIRAGMIAEDHVHAELGELLNGTKHGRANRDQITLYKSVGVAAQDAAATAVVLAAARQAVAGCRTT